MYSPRESSANAAESRSESERECAQSGVRGKHTEALEPLVQHREVVHGDGRARVRGACDNTSKQPPSNVTATMPTAQSKQTESLLFDAQAALAQRRGLLHATVLQQQLGQIVERVGQALFVNSTIECIQSETARGGQAANLAVLLLFEHEHGALAQRNRPVTRTPTTRRERASKWQQMKGTRLNWWELTCRIGAGRGTAARATSARRPPRRDCSLLNRNQVNQART